MLTTKVSDDSQRRISRSVDDIDCLHDDMGRLRKTECVLRTSKKKPDKVEVSVGGDASGKNRRRSDKKSIFGKTKKRSRSSSTEASIVQNKELPTS